MKIKFLGAAGTVTGSKYLVESDSGQRILIDCGLFQGLKELRLRNWDKFPVSPGSISAVILTHAHIDHSGYIPKLVREGFANEIYCTAPTRALTEILLEDSARLKEEDTEYANRKSFTKHRPALPLYTAKDVKKSLPLFRTRKLKEEFHISDFKLKFFDAGHILGAASVLVEADNTKILFSGDIGRLNDLLMTAPHSPPKADYIVMESTYGNKLHVKTDPVEAMTELLRLIIKRRSVLLIPSFAVGRAQTLLYCVYKVFEKYPDLKIPVFVNSPMAKEVTELYGKFLDEHKLNKNSCDQVCSAATFINSISESKHLNTRKGPMVIISASGMLTGGRILHHLQAFGGNPDNVILLVGFQAAGTRGADLAHGEKSIKFFGYYHDILAEVRQFDFFSAHADQEELLTWIKPSESLTKKIFLSHGEPQAADTLRRKIQETIGIDTHVAIDMEEINLKDLSISRT